MNGYQFLHVSTRNDKIGQTLNVSLPPIESCLPGVPCSADCYALGFYRMYPDVRKAWDENWKLWSVDPSAFENQLIGVLYHRKPIRFRWHVGGDIPSYKYAEMMLRLARLFPATQFLAYTQTNFVSQHENLTVIRSHWLGDSSYTPDRPHAYVIKDPMVDPNPNRLICPGLCPTCGYRCWSLKASQSVIFRFRPKGGPRGKKSQADRPGL